MFKEDGIYLISEIGINHNADMQVVKKLIDATFACGWDCVKFQKRNPEKCVPESQRGVLKDTPWGRMTYLEYKKRMEFSESQYDYIDAYCKEKPLSWTASVWDRDSLDFILKYDVPFIKIPSPMLSKAELVKAIADTGKPIIMSTGMSTVEEIDNSVLILDSYAPNNYALMHCNSTYPASLEDLNLNMIKTLKERYGCTIGYSGHEYGLEPTVIAVALGARIIERHITLDHNMWGTDQAASLEVHAMDLLRKRVVEANICLGDGVKRITEKEMKIREKLKG